MRSWTAVLACIWTSGCVVYRDADSTWSSPGSSTPGASPTGEVEVSWQVGGSGCEAAGIESVEIDLGGLVSVVDCADESAIVTGQVGRAALSMRGIDANGIARYEGDGGMVDVKRKQVVVAPTVLLSALPASLDVSWYFENGRLCSQNGVDVIEASLFDSEDVLHASDTKPCDVGNIELEEVQAGSYVLLLLGRTADGEVIYSGGSSFDAQRGDSLTIDVPLAEEP